MSAGWVPLLIVALPLAGLAAWLLRRRPGRHDTHNGVSGNDFAGSSAIGWGNSRTGCDADNGNDGCGGDGGDGGGD